MVLEEIQVKEETSEKPFTDPRIIHLFHAVLDQAIKDFLRGHKDGRLLPWFCERNSRYIFSFLHICQILQIDSDLLWLAIQAKQKPKPDAMGRLRVKY